jgi:hypothetical protein
MATRLVNVNAVVEAREVGRLEELDEAARANDAAVWVTERTARLGAPDAHDALLESLCDVFEALHPVPVLVPPTGAPRGLSRVVDAAERGGRVVRICPATHSYPVAGWVLSPIPEACERYDLALLIDFDLQQPMWQEVVEFARAFPRVPMVLLAEALDRDPVAGAALDATANLLLQLTPDCTSASHLLSIFGPGRFVCGTGHRPVPDPGNVWASLDDLRDEDRHAVLAGNAQLLADGAYAGTFL